MYRISNTAKYIANLLHRKGVDGKDAVDFLTEHWV